MSGLDPTFLRRTGIKAERPQESSFDPTAASDYLEGLVQSSAEGMAELVGHEPSQFVKDFRKEYPLSGFVSEFASPVGFYGGALKLGRLGKFGKMIDRMGSGYHPAAKRALQETTRLAPFDAGRVAVSAFTGGDVTDTALDAGLSLGITAGAGGLVGGLEAFGKRSLQRQALGESDITLPKQIRGREQLRVLQSAETEPAKRSRLADELDRFTDDILSDADVRHKKSAYVQAETTHGSRQEVNRIFKPTAPDAQTRMVSRAWGRQELDGLNSVFQTGVDTRAAPFYGQFFRRVSFRGSGAKRASQDFGARVRKNFRPIGDDWWMNKEKGQDGLYVLMKQARGGASKGKKLPYTTEGDQWLALKTDSPGFWANGPAKQMRPVTSRWAWLAKDDLLPDGAVNRSKSAELIHRMQQDIPVQTFSDENLRQGGRSITEMAQKFYGLGDAGYGAEVLGRWVRANVTPRMHQFRNNPIARKLDAIIKGSFEANEAVVNRFLYGTKKLKDEEALWANVARGPTLSGGLVDDLRGLGEVALDKLRQVLNDGLALEDARELGLSESLDRFLTKLDDFDKDSLAELDALQEGLPDEKKLFRGGRKGHYGISRSWEGTWRAPIYEGSEVTALGAGTTRAQAMDQAQFMADKLGKKYDGAVFQADVRDDIQLARQMRTDPQAFERAAQLRKEFVSLSRPSSFRQRKNVGGYEGETTLTKEQVEGKLRDHLIQVARYKSNLALDRMLQRDFLQLRADYGEEGYAMARQLEERISQHVGIQGNFSKAVNRAADTLLAPVFGKNSATSMVRNMNSAMFHLQLGAGNLAFGALSLMTWAQTVLPEISFVMSGAPSRLAKYYDTFAMAGRDGLARGSMGMLSPWKLAYRGFGELRKPSDGFREMLSRATADGTIDPRLAEEFVGQSVNQRGALGQVREAIKGGDAGSFMRGIGKMSEFVPASTERLSRAHAFATAYRFGKDVMGLDKDKLYSFSKQFTDRSMFLYGTSDRAMAMTGPIGSAFGLFKNWQLHYIHNLMTYVDEAVTHKNFQPLLTSFAGTSLVGGVTATPLYFAADRLSNWMTDQSFLENVRGQAEGNPTAELGSDALFQGMGFLPKLAGLPGFSLAGSASTFGADPQNDISHLLGFVYWDRMKSAGRAAGEAWDAWQVGANPLQSREVRGNLMKAFGPKAFYRSMDTVFDSAVNSMSSGYPSVSDLNPIERAMYMSGFNPDRVEYAYRSHEILWNDREAQKSQISTLGKLIAQSQDEGNWKQVNDYYKEAVQKGIDIGSVQRSARGFSQRFGEDMIERNFEGQRAVALQRMFGL